MKKRILSLLLALLLCVGLLPLTALAAAPASPKPSVKLNSSNQPVISWKVDKTNVGCYQLFRVEFAEDGSVSSEKVPGGYFAAPFKQSSINVTDKVDASAQQFIYCVQAGNKDGWSYSEYVTGGPAAVLKAPAAPTLTVISDSAGNPVLQWNKVADAGWYIIMRRSADGTVRYFGEDRDVTGNGFTDDTTTENSYSYALAAVNEAGYAYSAAVDWTKPNAAPAVPGGEAGFAGELHFTQTAQGVEITWDTVPDALAYGVLRFPYGNGNDMTVVGADLSECRFTDTTAEPGEDYAYKLAAANWAGWAYGSDFCCYTPYLMTGVPTLTLNGKALSWTAADNAEGYRVFRGTAAENMACISGEELLTALSYTDGEELSPYTRYYYVVAAVNRSGWSYSNMEATTPGAPQSVWPQGSWEIGNEYLLEWPAAEGAERYDIYCNGNKLADTTETSYTVDTSGWEPGSYSFTVQSVNAGGSTPGENSVSMTVLPAPILTIEGDVLRWSAVEGAGEYVIGIQKAGSKYIAWIINAVPTLSEGSYSYTLQPTEIGLEPGEYSVWVQAHGENSGDRSGFSNAVSYTVAEPETQEVESEISDF